MNDNKSNLKILLFVLTIAFALMLLPGTVLTADAATESGFDEHSNSDTGSGNPVEIEAMAGILALLAVGTGLTLNGKSYRAAFMKDNAADDAFFTHFITASAGTGGCISPSGDMSVEEGEIKTFVITPKSGYRISSVLVDNVNRGEIGTYIFYDVSDKHTIEANFEQN